MIKLTLFFLLSSVWLLQGCSTNGASSSSDSGSGGESRYRLQDDRPPDEHRDFSSELEPEPRFEPPSRGGNKNPYKVRGKTYHVMASNQGFVEEGIASWYGAKFHGYHTSNGEIYNMYAFTAAHKHLPLPGFVRVTNLDNGRQLIVRVNDRGPFHEDRIIDLSYGAASKLGVLQTGTARVRIENVMPPAPAQAPVVANASSVAPPPVFAAPKTAEVLPVSPGSAEAQRSGSAAPPPKSGIFLQVGAYSSELSAVKVRNDVSALVDNPVFLDSGSRSGNSPGGSNIQAVHRVRVGPFDSPLDAQKILGILQRAKYPDTLLIPAN